jgi:hypothetical protein
VDEFTVDANFEGTAAGRDQFGIHADRFTNESRQTGSFRFVVSDRAIFDRDLGFHAGLLPAKYPGPATLSRPRSATQLQENDAVRCCSRVSPTAAVSSAGKSRLAEVSDHRLQRRRCINICGDSSAPGLIRRFILLRPARKIAGPLLRAIGQRRFSSRNGVQRANGMDGLSDAT